MNNLKNATIRIIVSEPSDWKNLFGIIKIHNKHELIIQLSDKIKVEDLETDLLKLSPLNPNDTFKPLTQCYSVFVVGEFIDDSTKSNFIISGIVTLD